MRKAIAALLTAGMTLGAVQLSTVTATSAPPPGDAQLAPARDYGDELPNPLEDKRRALKETAIDLVMKGEASPERRNGSTVVKVGSENDSGSTQKKGGKGKQDQYVELANEGTDRVFTLLVEFGDQRHPEYPDVDTDPETPGPVTWDGPLHNQIPKPPKGDNSTIWEPDYSQAYFQDLYFGDSGETLKAYYEKQSSGRYSVDGEVSPWVKVPYNEARYGRSTGFPCEDVVCDNVYNLVTDGMDAWYDGQLAAGRTPAQVEADLESFDVYDRYDFDGDGNFNESDGYVDHLQIIHAGGDEADGDPIQGEDAIWSHRAYAFQSDEGTTGPEGNLLGGVQVGDSGIWAGDYTLQAENGGLSTIAHEYGHDLGLPDHYDTAGGDNGVEWWTLMAQSRLGGKGEPIGTKPGDLGAWDKLVLGWLDYELFLAGDDATLQLGPHEYNSPKAQAVAVLLPDKAVTRSYGPPFAGEGMFWSGSGDDLANTMVRDLDLTGRTTAALDLKARYDIEAGYDYLYVQYSADGGTSWTPLDGTADGAPFSRDGSDNPAIDGSSDGEWVDVHVPLDAIAGQNVKLRFLYRTDGGVAPVGFFADEITVTADGATVLTSGAEGTPADAGWTLDGFKVSSGTESGLYQHYYLASNRTYASWDQYLQTGPYNFGFLNTKPSFVEHFPYQTGLLVSYVDTSWNDNNTSEHPGGGLVLPVDAHPDALKRPDGLSWRSRVQVYDAPFGLKRTDAITLHQNGVPSQIPSLPGNPRFDDTVTYYRSSIPLTGVVLPKVGVQIDVLSQSGTSMTVRVH